MSRSASSGYLRLRLFRNTIVGVEAVGELLAVLVRGVFGKQLAVCSALEGLEAGLALDALGGGVLYMISKCAHSKGVSATLSSNIWRSYGFQLRLGLLGPSIALAVALLLCSTMLLVLPRCFFCRNAVLRSVAHVVSYRGLVGNCESRYV
jgi:hypothetical protein